MLLLETVLMVLLGSFLFLFYRLGGKFLEAATCFFCPLWCCLCFFFIGWVYVILYGGTCFFFIGWVYVITLRSHFNGGSLLTIL